MPCFHFLHTSSEAEVQFLFASGSALRTDDLRTDGAVHRRCRLHLRAVSSRRRVIKSQKVIAALRRSDSDVT